MKKRSMIMAGLLTGLVMSLQGQGIGSGKAEGSASDLKNTVFNYESFKVSDVARKALKPDHRVQLIGVVGDMIMSGPDVAHWYELKGYEGGSIFVNTASAIPLTSTHIILRGIVKIDASLPAGKNKYVFDVAHVKLDSNKIDNIVAHNAELKSIAIINSNIDKYALIAGETMGYKVIDPDQHKRVVGEKVITTTPPPIPWTLILVILVSVLIVILVVALLVVLLKKTTAQTQMSPLKEPGEGYVPPPNNVPVAAEETIVMPSGEVTQVLDPKTIVMSKGWLEVIAGGRPAGTKITLPAPFAVVGRRVPGQNRGEKYIGLDLSNEQDTAVRNALSREQAKISYDNGAKAFRIENIAKSGTLVTVNGTDLGSGDAATLEEGSIIKMQPYWEFKFHVN